MSTIEIDFTLGMGPGQAKILIDGRELDGVSSLRLTKSVNEPTRLHLALIPEVVIVRGPVEEVTQERALIQAGALGQRGGEAPNPLGDAITKLTEIRDGLHRAQGGTFPLERVQKLIDRCDEAVALIDGASR